MHITIDNSKVARCQHIKADGIQCNTPAMKSTRFCYYHSQLERTFRKPHRPPPVIGFDTIAAIRLALTDIANRVMRDVMDPAKARIMLRTIQSATILLKQQAALRDLKPAPIVTDTAALAAHVNPNADRDGYGGEERLDRPPLDKLLDSAWMHIARQELGKEVELEERAKAIARYSVMPTPGPSPYTMLPDEYDDADNGRLTISFDRRPDPSAKRTVDAPAAAPAEDNVEEPDAIDPDALPTEPTAAPTPAVITELQAVICVDEPLPAHAVIHEINAIAARSSNHCAGNGQSVDLKYQARAADRKEVYADALSAMIGLPVGDGGEHVRRQIQSAGGGR